MTSNISSIDDLLIGVFLTASLIFIVIWSIMLLKWKKKYLYKMFPCVPNKTNAARLKQQNRQNQANATLNIINEQQKSTIEKETSLYVKNPNLKNSKKLAKTDAQRTNINTIAGNVLMMGHNSNHYKVQDMSSELVDANNNNVNAENGELEVVMDPAHFEEVNLDLNPFEIYNNDVNTNPNSNEKMTGELDNIIYQTEVKL